MLGGLGLSELMVILVLVFVVFGAGKLPGVGKALGQSIKEFKGSVSVENDEEKDINN